MVNINQSLSRCFWYCSFLCKKSFSSIIFTFPYEHIMRQSLMRQISIIVKSWTNSDKLNIHTRNPLWQADISISTLHYNSKVVFHILNIKINISSQFQCCYVRFYITFLSRRLVLQGCLKITLEYEAVGKEILYHYSFRLSEFLVWWIVFKMLTVFHIRFRGVIIDHKNRTIEQLIQCFMHQLPKISRASNGYHNSRTITSFHALRPNLPRIRLRGWAQECFYLWWSKK